METFRITLEKYSKQLIASGNPARWNSKDVRVVYTASSRALACLENVVHRSSLGLQQIFRTMVIHLPDELDIKIITEKELRNDWPRFENYPHTQALGDNWFKNMETAILQVPSSIIPEEFNYLLNPLHADFSKIKLLRTEPFQFDERIKK
jgi:RES domain-containing protein